MDAVNAISTVGFPIIACIGIAKYFVKIQQQNNETVKELTEALNNNTIALTKLVERLEK